MIQEDYVTFEQAKALKELEFHYPVAYWYCDTYDDEDNPTHQFEMVAASIPTYVQNYNDLQKFPFKELIWDNVYSAPTLSLVQKWLREEKGLYIEVTRWDQDEDPIEHGFYWEILDSTNYKKILAHCMEPLYSKPEHALSAGIDKCIELLKNSL